NGGKNSLNRLIRCVCGKKIGPDPRNFNQRVSLGRNDLLIRTFPIALPEERIVSVCPKCDMGHIAHMLWRIKNMFILTAILMFMFACVCLVKSLNEVGWEQLDFWKEYFFSYDGVRAGFYIYWSDCNRCL
ncbi:hypothetical protein AAHD56_25340, partial [Enterobacter kobei]|uniref:hypothetical protein n=1 Tax=Enterobacter kobei TaxID=208224 RepID=UPI003966AA76